MRAVLICNVLGLFFFYTPSRATATPLSPACAPLLDVLDPWTYQRTRTAPQALLEATSALRDCNGGTLPVDALRFYTLEVMALDRLQFYSQLMATTNEFIELYLERALPAQRMYLLGMRNYTAWAMGDEAERLRTNLLQVEHMQDLDVEGRAYALSSLAQNYVTLQDFARATTTFDRLATLLRDHSLLPQVADSLLAIATIHRAEMVLSRPADLNDAVLADMARQLSVARQQAQRWGNTDQLARIAINDAEVHFRQGDFGTARRLITSASARYSTSPEANTNTRTLLAYKHGWLFMEMGQVDQATALLHEALRQSEAHQLDARTSDALGTLGYAYELLGDTAQAEVYYRRDIALVERFRQRLAGTDWSSLAFGSWQHSYRHLVRLLVQSGRVDEAFVMLSNVKARSLQDQLSHTELYSLLSPADRAAYNQIEQQLYRVEDRLRDADVSDRQTLQTRALDLKQRLSRLLGMDALRAPTLSLPALQTDLERTGTNMIAYIIDQEYRQAGTAYVPLFSGAFVVDATGVRWQPLIVSEASLRGLLSNASALWTEQADPAAVPAMQLGTLHQLYLDVFAPLTASLQASSVVVVPDGSLYLLPFASLIATPPSGHRYDAASYLVYEYAFSYALSPALFTAAPSPGAPVDVVAFGLTTFPESFPASDPFREGLSDLPAVGEEIAYVTARYPRSRAFLNAEATDVQLMRAASQGRILHIATHAVINPSQSNYSYLRLAPTDSTDGAVYLYHVPPLRLSNELAVLNACNTGRGDWRAGEGLVGLNYAFRASGVRSTMANMWFVDDLATTQLTRAFYEGLSMGLPKPRALANAQRDFLSSCAGSRCNPFFWAAPVVYGAPTPVYSSIPLAPYGTRLLWLVVVLLIVVAVLNFLPHHLLS